MRSYILKENHKLARFFCTDKKTDTHIYEHPISFIRINFYSLKKNIVCEIYNHQNPKKYYKNVGWLEKKTELVCKK